ATDEVSGEGHAAGEAQRGVLGVTAARPAAEDDGTVRLSARRRAHPDRALGDRAGDVAAEGVLDAPRERAGLAGRVDDRAYPGARREVAPDDRGGRATFHRVGLHRDGPAGDLGLLGLLVGVLVVAVLAVVDGG